jgi:hypothetical protein
MGVYEVVEGELAEDNKAIQLEEQKSQPRRVVLSLQVLGSMLQFAVSFVITPSCRGGRSKTETPKPKMGCKPSKKQNNAKKQGPRAASP